MQKNTLIAAFCAVFFYIAVKSFKYRLMNKRFFGIEFKFWVSKGGYRFQFILIKNNKQKCTTSYGKKADFSFLNLFKDLKDNLNNITKQERMTKNEN